jgi:hypothetical protein
MDGASFCAGGSLSMALCTPHWLLERVALGDLPPDALADARARLARELDGDGRLARLEEDSRRTLERHPPEAVAAEVERRRATGARVAAAGEATRGGWNGLSLGVPVAASLALLCLSSQQEPLAPAPVRTPIVWTGSERIKGAPMLRVHRRVGTGEPEQLEDHARVRQGDVLQLSYTSGGHPHGVVVSVDGRGAVMLHHPAALSDSTALTPGEAAPLGHAYELDDAPAFERFLLVTSREPLDVAAVLEAARTLARQPSEARTRPLPLPETLVQTSFVVEKVQ